jgi:hypothetical protein
MTFPRLWAATQIAGTLLTLAFVPGSLAKALVLIALWAATFRRLSFGEALLFAAACAIFTLMNALSLAQGVFWFARDDVLGMPYYELVMWGFYVTHTWRVLDGSIPAPSAPAAVLAVLFAACFVVSSGWILLGLTAAVLTAALYFFHERLDLAYAGYMVGLGALVEYTGVWTGEWGYPGDPPGGVPLWFVTLWGGVGLLLRRAALPLLAACTRQP